MRLATEGKQQEALAAFGELETQDIPAYRSLALLRAASELAKAGDHEQATKKFDAIANDSSAEENLRSIARIRAAMLLVDHGTVAEVESRVGPLTAPGRPSCFSAREALGLAYYKAGDLENAFQQFSQVINDSEAPPALSQRVQIMLDLIASRGGPVREQ